MTQVKDYCLRGCKKLNQLIDYKSGGIKMQILYENLKTNNILAHVLDLIAN